MSRTTTTSITIDLSNKTISYSGAMAVRENVDVRLLGCTAADVDSIKLRILNPDDDVLALCDTWVNMTTYFQGDLDLDKTALIHVFSGDAANKYRKFYLHVWNNKSGNESLVIADMIYIMNNPYTVGVEAQNV